MLRVHSLELFPNCLRRSGMSLRCKTIRLTITFRPYARLTLTCKATTQRHGHSAWHPIAKLRLKFTNRCVSRRSSIAFIIHLIPPLTAKQFNQLNLSPFDCKGKCFSLSLSLKGTIAFYIQPSCGVLHCDYSIHWHSSYLFPECPIVHPKCGAIVAPASRYRDAL